MVQRIEQNPRRRLRVGRARQLPGASDARSDAERPVDDSHSAHGLHPRLRLPPTRAARQARSRGAFLEAAGRAADSGKSRRANVSIATLALALVALVSALIVSAPSVITGIAVAANPAFSIVGSASVPPPFIAPTKAR